MSDATDEGKESGKAAGKSSAKAPAGTTTGRRAEPRSERGRGAGGPGALHRVRSVLASFVWMLAVLAALVLAVGALLVALGFNTDHPLVDFVIEVALRIDLGELKAFDGDGDDVRTKWVLVNWGIASLAYLVVGKLLDRLIRP